MRGNNLLCPELWRMMDRGMMGDGEEKAAEPPNRMKFSTAPVKTQRGGAGGRRVAMLEVHGHIS